MVALAPLFTVLIYRIFWQVIYSRRIYLSLVPLTVGVMLVCSSNVKFHSIGFFCSLMSTLIFATQNIFSKKLFLHARHANLEQIQTKLNKNNQNNSLNSPINTTAQNIGNKVADLKLDKLNLLFYSAFLAFILMFPIWMYTEGIQFFTDYSILPSMKVSFLFLLNGVTNFTQNMFAFTILSLVSPVTYSIASLVKRIFVITASIIWFGDSVSKLQGFGIFLTFLGLWMYDQARMDVAKSEARLNLTESTTLTLPTTNILNKNRDEEEKSRSWNKDSIPRSNSFNKNINLNEIYSRGSYLKEVY
ncbi:suppressor of loss of ypt1 [Clydaea vesicula]|uniref:Suppressor of loss of ypt1 n=1 Tax=Clydaea vesicula TaxID=447962 RepID=A0AAD5U7T1_9FUNG|nr:suppressor of loss of ypt1 [Clydaea vesicula]